MQSGEFISLVKQDCEKHGVKLYLTDYKKVNLVKCRVGGYFSEEDKEIRVARNKPHQQWLGVLVHEYCHMRQWIENDPLSDSRLNNQYESGYAAFHEWLLKEIDLSDKDLKKACKIAIQCERDCEQRVIRMIKKYNLPINLTYYYRDANLVLYTYRLAMMWGDNFDIGPYRKSKRLKKMMPLHLRNQHHKTIPKDILKAFEKVRNDSYSRKDT